MILDGQQRVQSMLLALGGDNFGFKLYDHEWFEDKEIRRPTTEHWTQASLHLDLKGFINSMDEHDDEVHQIPMESILNWVVTDRNMQSQKPKPPTYEEPLPRLWEEPGRYIRFSRLWDMAQGGVSELKYNQLIPDFLKQQEVDADQFGTCTPRLAALLRTIGEIKTNTQVQTLRINALTVTPQWTVEDYNDGIVNIFTRLNTAGRTLTREEITLAWLKVGWKQECVQGNKSAGECLNDIIALLEDEGLEVSIDEVVRLLSFFWSVQKRDGQLLTDRDLLKGDVITPMADNLSKEWDHIIYTLTYAARTLKERDLTGNTGSFNALIVGWCWLFLADRWGYSHRDHMRVREEDEYGQRITELYGQFMDRWLFMSQWANTWSSNVTKNLQTFAKMLSGYNKDLTDKTDLNNAYDLLEKAASGLLEEVRDAASNYIRTFSVSDRRKVSQYKGILWVWQRLDSGRHDKCMILLKRGRERKEFTPEVDHTIADAFWKKCVSEELQRMIDNGEDLSVPDGSPEKGPTGFGTRQEAEAFINSLGNCSMLRKGFNISKSDKPMWDFLQEVHEFKNAKITREIWQNALCMTSVMTSPDTCSFDGLVQAIKDRDQKIREDMNDFISGKQKRQDV
jgi:hypothetical protein